MYLRNPLPLSAAQEAQVKQLYYKRVRGYCAAEIKGMHFIPP
jgi:COX assembly mitochondrial protein 1